MDKTAEKTTRPAHTTEQLEQANLLAAGAESLAPNRETVDTYTVDDVDPNVLTDRDDGIRVESRPEGGYRVNVAISDVAHHVAPDTPLGNAPTQRGHTIYRPGAIDHMFPKELMHKMSLDNKTIRPALEVRIDLDENFHPTHTELARVNARTTAHSYETAQAAYDASDHEDHQQFRLMQHIARGLTEKHFGGSLDALLQTEQNNSTEIPHNAEQTSQASMAATKMVAVYMLLANQAVAGFFAQTDLPFAYRNFRADLANSSKGTAKAFYNNRWDAHNALEKDGLKGAYCHFTSPIRRGPDYLNGLMAHYAIDIAEHIAKSYPTLSHDELWQHMPQILDGVSKDATKTQEALEALGLPINTDTTALIMELFRDIPIPLHAPQLVRDLDHINALNDVELEVMRTKYKQLQKMGLIGEDAEGKSLAERMDAMVDDNLTIAQNSRLIYLLRAACEVGHMPERLKNELVHRLEERKITGSDLNLTATEIVLNAPYPKVKPWRELKRAVSKIIQDSPNLVDTLFERAPKILQQKYGYALELKPSDFAVDEHGVPQPALPTDAHNSDEQTRQIHLAGVLLYGNDGVLAPPSFSVGHDKRAALTHAKYNFLNKFAFSELVDIDQVMIPNMHYLELESGKTQAEILERIVQENVSTSKNSALCTRHTAQLESGRWMSDITVSGGRLERDVIKQYAKGDSQEEAIDKAARRVLRNPAFHALTSTPLSTEIHEMLNPHFRLAKLLQEEGLTLEIDHTEHAKQQFSAKFYFKDAQTGRYDSMWESKDSFPNKDRATRAAALEFMETQLALPTPNNTVSSWATPTTVKPAPSALIGV